MINQDWFRRKTKLFHRRSKNFGHCTSSSTTTNQSIYLPLSSESEEFRLVKVSLPTFPSTTIACSLHIFSLKYAPYYSALSYTWGSGVASEKVFTLLSLVNGPGLFIEPSYTNTVEDVFVQSTFQILAGSRSFLILGQIGLVAKNLTSLPSWVPDWSTARQIDPEYRCLDSHMFRDKCEDLFHASPDNIFTAAMENPTTLHLASITAGKIVHVCNKTREKGVDLSTVSPIHSLESASGICQSHSTSLGIHRENEDIQQDLWQTLIFGTVNASDASGVRRSEGSDIDTLIAWQVKAESEHTSVPGSDFIDSISTHISNLTAKRRLAWTDNNSMALVPEDTQEGDYVLVFAGATLPWICRPVIGKDKTYTIIGEAFVLGVMNGEMALAPARSTEQQAMDEEEDERLLELGFSPEGIRQRLETRMMRLFREWDDVYIE